jgi:hypothetical protein
MSENSRLPGASKSTRGSNSAAVVFAREQIPIEGNDQEHMAMREDARKDPRGFGGRDHISVHSILAFHLTFPFDPFEFSHEKFD